MDTPGVFSLSGHMRKGIFASLRGMRRLVIQAVALAFILPALIGLLPQPALSAAAALDRDLLTAVCGQDRPAVPQGAPQHQVHEHCVLCAAHGPSFVPGLAAATPAFAAAPPRRVAPAPAASCDGALPLQALLDARPPRGPPSLA